MSYMDYKSAREISRYITCKSEWEAFDCNYNTILGREVRACFSKLRMHDDINRIKIYMYAYEPGLSIQDNVFYNSNKGFGNRFYPITDLSISMMRNILYLVKDIVNFGFSVSGKHVIDENHNDRRQYCINLLFPSDTNVIQKMFVCTIARWFYEQQNRYIALKAYELYNTEKYHRFGFFNLYCFIKEQCCDNVNSSGHDLLDGNDFARTSLYVPKELKSLYKMSSLLHNGENITKLWETNRYSRIPVKNTSVRVTEMYCKGGKQEFDLQERLESNIDFIVSKIKGNETFDCENEEQ